MVSPFFAIDTEQFLVAVSILRIKDKIFIFKILITLYLKTLVTRKNAIMISTGSMHKLRAKKPIYIKNFFPEEK